MYRAHSSASAFGLRLAASAVIALLVSAASAHAQITYVAKVGTKTSAASGTTLGIKPLATVVVGHFVVVAVATRAQGAVSCADNKGNTYTTTVRQANTTGTISQTAVCTAPITTQLLTTDTITVTHPTATYRAATALEFSGVAATYAFDKYNSGQANGVTGNAPSSGATRNTAQGNELLIGAIGVAGNTNETFTPAAGWTQPAGTRAGTCTGCGTAMTINPMYQIVSSTSTYTASGTMGTNHTWAATVSTYRSATLPQAGATGSLSFGAPENNYASIPDAASLTPAALTVEAWLKPAPFPASSPWIAPVVKASSGSWADGYGMYISTDVSAVATLHFWVNNYTAGVASATIAGGQWSHVAGTFDGATVNLYINGALAATLAYATPITYVAGSALTLGNNVGGTAYNGEIDEVRVWNVARTQSQLQNYAHMTSLPTDATLAGYWMADAGAASTTLADSSGNANNGTFNSTQPVLQGVWNTSTAPLGPGGQTTTGTITAATATLTLAAAIDFANGDIIYVNQDNSTVFVTTISSGGGTTTLTLAANAPANSTGLTVGHATGAWVETTNPNTAGHAGGTLQATITSVPVDDNNNVGLYQFGSTTGAALSAGETFPGGVVSRSNVVLGVVSRGTVTADLFIDYSGIGGIMDATTVTLLTRADANTMTWTAVTPTTRDDNYNTMTLSAQSNPAGEFAIGFASAPTAVTLVSFNATQYDRGVLLEWRTGYEVNNLGFNVYREVNGRRTRLTSSPVAGSGLVVGQGTAVNSVRSYAWWDLGASAAAAPSGPASYWLEDLDFNGTSTFHGPVTPVAGSDLVPTQAVSEVLRGLGSKSGGASDSNMSVPHGEPLGRRWGPDEGPKKGQTLDSHEAGTLVVAGAPAETQWNVAATPGVKIGVRAAGWYHVNQADLVAAGLNPNIDPRKLRLFAEGIEQAMVVTGEASGRFGPGNAIEFYGTGVDTPYTDTKVYWLVAGADRGRRVGTGDGGMTGTLSSAASFLTTRQRKDRSIYFAALENGDADNWFGPVISNQPTDFTLQLENLDTAATSPAELEVTLQGVTTMVGHHVNLLLNGTAVGQLTFNGQAHGVASVSVPQSLLTEGSNTVTLVAAGGDADISLFDTVHLSYWHTYRADADRLWATVEGQKTVTLGGFTSSTIRVVDITDPTAAVELLGTTVSEDSGAWGIRLQVPGTGSRTLLAFTQETVSVPTYLRRHQPTRWHDSTQAADYVLVAHPTLINSLSPLTALRAREGHTVAVVDVDDVYGEFSFGEKTPLAIKNFLRSARTTWRQPPQFVVLVGDATIDPRDYAGLGAADLVPTKQVPMVGVSLKTASDDWFVDFADAGLPDFPVGRLAVRTTAQAQIVVDKIVTYQRSPPPSWAKDVLLVADQNDATANFEASSTALHRLLPSGYRAHDIFRGQLGADGARRALLDAVNQGQLLVDYQGHGSVQLWGKDTNLLTNDDVYALWRNAGRLPFVVTMDCLNGLFDQIWDEESLAEALMRAPQGGAVAVWASSSVTLPASQTPVNQELFRLIFQGRFATLGEAVVAAKRAGTDPDLRRSMIFFGDPAMQIIGLAQATTSSTSGPTLITTTLISGAPASSSAAQQSAQDAAFARATLERTAVRLADLTGEGRATVLLYAPETGKWATTASSGIAGVGAGQWRAHQQIVPARLTGRAQADLVFYDPATGAWIQALNTGKALVQTAGAIGVRDGQVRVGDFTGEGFDDVLTYASTSGAWTLGVSDGQAGIRTIRKGAWPAVARLYVADLTGDGLADVVGYDATTGTGFVAINQGQGQFHVSSGAWGSGWQVEVGNFNGDNLADLFFYDPVSGAWLVGLSDGLGGFTSWSGTWPSGLVIHLTDLNGDGRDDVVGYNPTTGEWLIGVTGASGDFLVERGTWTPGFIVGSGDLKGDGRGDIVLYDPVTGNGFELFMLAPGSFDVRSDTWMSGAVLIGQGSLTMPTDELMVIQAATNQGGSVQAPAAAPAPTVAPAPSTTAVLSATTSAAGPATPPTSATSTEPRSLQVPAVPVSPARTPSAVGPSLPTAAVDAGPSEAAANAALAATGNASTHRAPANSGGPVGTSMPGAFTSTPAAAPSSSAPSAPSVAFSLAPSPASEPSPDSTASHATTKREAAPDAPFAMPTTDPTPTTENVDTKATCSAPPAPPRALSARVSGSTVTFTWDDPPGRPRSYAIEAESSTGSTNLSVSDTGTAGTLYSASRVEPGRYSVRVRARNRCGVGAASNAILVTIAAPAGAVTADR